MGTDKNFNHNFVDYLRKKKFSLKNIFGNTLSLGGRNL